MSLNCLFTKAKTLFSLLLLLISFNGYGSNIIPFKAVYDLYLKGYYIGQVEQSLSDAHDYWLIQQKTQAKGFASLFQSEPIFEKQSFTIHNKQFHLKSFQFKDDETNSSAFYQEAQSKLLINHNGKTQSQHIAQPIYSYLLLALKAHFITTKEEILTVYDQGVTSQVKSTSPYEIQIQHHGQTTKAYVVEFTQLGSKKKLRYTFLSKSDVIPIKIERLSDNKADMLLQKK